MSRAERDKWNDKEKIATEAKKWNTKADFAGANKVVNPDGTVTNEGCQSAYQAARRLGILDEVCSHMEKPKRGRKKGVKKTTPTVDATSTPTVDSVVV